ncbi:tetratricopeptide repeat protein [Pseudanabaena sp. FACHB-1998]|uniref:CHAT domain-containing protein n=1 Tax=Pseudanabaena sp. FACHB-1998 TaxID=2692858 RepID=UPI0016802328|nr:tetratricopeptide repeat protein [Pseudanabaena sp. FACHB-1998]MBD2178703.1 tetratricopeptide repeat protein [Pseudanabaena sp. FACHB-1998]
MLSRLKLLLITAIAAPTIAILTISAIAIAPIAMAIPAIAQTTSRPEADRLLELGKQQYRSDQFEAAIESWQKALAIYRVIKDKEGEGKALGNIGSANDALGKYDQAIAYHQLALAIDRELKDRKGEGISVGNLGNAYNALGNYNKALEYYQQELAIAKEISDRQAEGAVLGKLAITYETLGKYERAIELFGQELAIAREINDRQAVFMALGNLGLAYKALGNYGKALESHQESLAIARLLKNRQSEGIALGNLGNTYKSLGNYGKAIKFHQESLDLLRQTKDRLGEGAALGNLGNVFFAVGNYNKAIEYQQNALKILREIKDRLGEGVALDNLGNAYRELGDFDKAIAYQQQSLEIKRAIGDRFGERVVIGNLGFAYTSLSDYAKAFAYQQQSLAIAKKLKDRDGEGISFDNLGYLFAKQNQLELAILYYKQAVNVRESIRKDIKNLNKTEQQSYTNTIAGSYRRLADLLVKQGRVMEALQILDLLKIQELEDYLKNIQGNDRTSQGVRILEPERVVSDRLLTLSFEKTAELNRSLASQIRQLPNSEINRVPEYLQKLPQGHVLLYPMILSDRLEIVLFSPNSLPIHRAVAIAQADLSELIQDFKSDLQDFTSEDARDSGYRLYKLLIEPIEGDLVATKAKTILYAPDRQLRYIPLAALYDGKNWLIERYRVSNLIAYSLSDFSPKPKIAHSILAGAFGGKNGELKFGQYGIPATINEIRAIVRSQLNSTALEENTFSRQGIESRLKQHNILHLATHAEFNTGSPNNSRIFFGNGDILNLGEISALPLQNIDLIVLSACQTGVGKLGNGVEILGFGYQVQKAGAKTAIASLWSVDDRGTQALMEAFYRELQKGNLTISETLQSAQLKAIGSTKFNHPAYWSAFFIIGNGL